MTTMRIALLIVALSLQLSSHVVFLFFANALFEAQWKKAIAFAGAWLLIVFAAGTAVVLAVSGW